MLRLVVRRAWVQRRLLSAVVLLVVVATTLMGFYALLLGVTGPRAFSEQVRRTEPQEVSVTAFAVGLSGADLDATRREARGVVRQVLDPLHPTLVSTATSAMRRLDDAGRLGYLATTDALSGPGALTSGRWPHDHVRGPVEAVAPDAAARLLGLHLGDRIVLGPGAGLGQNRSSATVMVVGTFRGLPHEIAQSDPLTGAGFDPAYTDGGATAAPTYGPFLVGRRAFVATGFDVAALRVDGHPDLSAVDDTALRGTVASLRGASALLADRVGSAAGITRVGSQLPETLDRLHVQQATTRSAVLVALLLDTTLGLAALVLAGRLVADTRADERELLTTLGLGPVQQLASALVEAVLLAVAATIVAVPAAAVAYAVVTHLPALSAARLAEPLTVTPGLVLTALAGAVLLTVVLVVSPLVGWDTAHLSGRRRVLARSGVDVLLLAVAVVGWWQLRSTALSAGRTDTVLVLAPVLCLAAITVVAVRALPPLFGLAASAATRTRSLLPVALDPAALRVGAGTALVLLSLAAAAATFGLALHTTWHRSQGDQADLRVGTHLSLTLEAPPTAEDAATIVRAAGRDRAGAPVDVSPVTDRPVALGHYLGTPGAPPGLVALDTRQAASLLLGRLPDGTTWADVGRRLAPGPAVRGIPMPAGGAGVTMTGHAPAGVAVSVTPSLVVQDASGFRSTVGAEPLAVDGRTHPVQWSAPPAPGQRIVALFLSFSSDEFGDPGDDRSADVAVSLRVPGPGGGGSTRWQAQQLSASGVVLSQSVAEHRARQATVLVTRARLHPSYLVYDDGEVLATAFDPPSAVPVAVSRALAEATGARVGGQLSATLGDSVLLLQVVEIVPTVPSAPGRIAVLADVDTVSRALIGTGHLEPAVDAFWVSPPTADRAGALRRLELGDVTTRDAVAAELTRSPMHVTLPVAYLTVVGSAVVLLLAGAVLVVSADQRRRTSEVGRLRALGLPRAGARRLVFVQHAALLVALVVAGVLIGGLTAAALDPLLVASDQGAAPVPSPVLAWPWATEAALAIGLVLAVSVVAAVAAVTQVRVSDTAHQKAGE